MMRVAIIGAGPGSEQWLTVEAREQIRNAERVIATDRLYQALSHMNPNTVRTSLSEIPDAVREAGACRNVAILVSGDCGFHSLGKTLPALLREKTGNPGLEVTFVNGISSMQYLCARFGLSYDDARILSLHGRSGDLVPFVCYNAKVFALTGGIAKPRDIIGRLAEAGLGGVSVFAGSHLGTPAERLASGSARSLANEDIPEPACLLILNERSRDPHERLPDGAFIRGKTPMTKAAVRTLVMDALDIRPGDTVIDIGAGTGSVSVCMARKAFEGTVHAVERNGDALALLAQNRKALGAYNVTIVRAEAPDGLEAIPVPDKAFIGGSGGRLPEIMRALFAGNPDIRIAVTAITLESLHAAVAAFQEHGRGPEISCVNVATARAAGPCHMMKAENPVYIIASGSREKEEKTF